MQFLLLAGISALVCGVISWWLVKRFAGGRRWLPFLIPPTFWFGLLYLTRAVVERFAVCDAPDCGPLLFAAMIIIGSVVAMSGLIGSLLGVWQGLRSGRG